MLRLQANGRKFSKLTSKCGAAISTSKYGDIDDDEYDDEEADENTGDAVTAISESEMKANSEI